MGKLAENTQAVFEKQQLFASVRWRCRRGMRELDQVLLRFLEHMNPDNVVEMQSFKAMLEVEDSDLWQWVMGRTQPTRTDWGKIIEKIRNTTHS